MSNETTKETQVTTSNGRKKIEGWRKFSAFLFMILISAFLTYKNKLNGDHFVSIGEWSMIVFFVTNGAANIAQQLNQKVKISLQ